MMDVGTLALIIVFALLAITCGLWILIADLQWQVKVLFAAMERLVTPTPPARREVPEMSDLVL